ncbi:MAG: YnbE family lipoprotein [Desulfobacula sp.]|nr:YnbE family lipoprotein [Desulfobacula sp.]
MIKNLVFITLFLMVFVFTGCQTQHDIQLKPVEIKPIHITIDVNIRVEKALDDFFDDLEDAEDEIKE